MALILGSDRPSPAPAALPIFRTKTEPHDRTRMPRAKPSATTGTAELNAMIERVAPAILGLLADGEPRSKAAIVAALAGRHDKQDVVHTLIRLAVTGRVEETGGRYTVETPGEGS